MAKNFSGVKKGAIGRFPFSRLGLMLLLLGLELLGLIWLCNAYTCNFKDFLVTLEKSENLSKVFGGVLPLLLSAPFALSIWHWRDQNKVKELDNTHLQIRLSDLRELVGLIANENEEVQATVVYLLKNYLLNDKDPIIREASWQMLLGLMHKHWKAQSPDDFFDDEYKQQDFINRWGDEPGPREQNPIGQAVLSIIVNHGSELKKFNWKGINLNMNDLSKADLRGLDLSQTGLFGAYLYGADLRGTDLSGARWHKYMFWHEAIYDSNTRFPAGFSPEEHEMIRKPTK